MLASEGGAQGSQLCSSDSRESLISVFRFHRRDRGHAHRVDARARRAEWERGRPFARKKSGGMAPACAHQPTCARTRNVQSGACLVYISNVLTRSDFLNLLDRSLRLPLLAACAAPLGARRRAFRGVSERVSAEEQSSSQAQGGALVLS